MQTGLAIHLVKPITSKNAFLKLITQDGIVMFTLFEHQAVNGCFTVCLAQSNRLSYDGVNSS